MPSDDIICLRPDSESEIYYLVRFFDKRSSWSWISWGNIYAMFEDLDADADMCKISSKASSITTAYKEAEEVRNSEVFALV